MTETKTETLPVAERDDAHAATQTATTVDKSAWPRGPWDTEPDAVSWICPAPPHYRCEIKRNDFGALCGYVLVPPRHPAHGHHYCEDVFDGIDLDNALTHADLDDVSGEWAIGFHCSNRQDVQPGLLQAMRWLERETWHPRDVHRRLMKYLQPPGATYKTVDYVREQCESLALQLAALESGPQ
jgi:hypothetical protein